MTSQAETFCRDRRLYDVRRGVVYLRRTDELAQRQWRHYGTVPSIKTHVIRDIGVTTRLSDVTTSQDDAVSDAAAVVSEANARGSTSDARGSVSDAASVGETKRGLSGNKKFICRTTVLEESGSARPRISVTEVTDRIPSANPDPQAEQKNPQPESQPERNAAVASPSCDPNVSTTTTTTTTASVTAAALQGTTASTGTSATDSMGVLSRDPSDGESRNLPSAAFSHPVSTSKDLQHSLRESRALPEDHPLAAQFNTWGSRDWALEGKLEPDPQPRSHAPKRYPPMSRAAGAGLGKSPGVGRRQLRTLTDFRSRNGTVRIIQPLAPNVDIVNAPAPAAPEQDEDFDMDTLSREKTYAMLKRIDRLLEPTRAYFTSDLASSEREVCSSSTPSTCDLTDSLPESDELRPKRRFAERFHGQLDHSHGNTDVVHVHNDNFRRYFADEPRERDDQFHGRSHLSREQPGYFSLGQRPQRRPADHFREPPDHFRGSYNDRIHGRSNPFRGHSEPPRGRFDLSGREDHHPQAVRGHSEDVRGQNAVARATQERSGDYYHDPRPGQYDYNSKLRPLPPLQHPHPLPQGHGEVSSDPHRNRHCSRMLDSMPARKPGGGGGGGGGSVGVGVKRKGGMASGSLREVVDKLEKKGVDLHLKCENWIAKSFSHHDHQHLHPAT